MISVQDLIEKRKRSWAKRHDIKHDDEIVGKYATLLTYPENAHLRREIKERPYLLIEVAFSLVDKAGHWCPFFLNDVQKDFIHRLETRTDTRPFYILKGRQQGFTSLITAIQLSYALVRENFSGYTLANTSDNVQSIFEKKCKLIYNRLPDAFKPHEKYNSKHEMYFDERNSGWRVAVASDEVGRSATIQFLHMSEIAFFECSLEKMQKSIGEAIAEDSNPIVVYETTANGFNEAQELWQSGTCTNLFYEWWRTTEYISTEYEYMDSLDEWLRTRVQVLRDKGLTKEQICWYCKKYKSYKSNPADSIKQEYPCSPEEAFISSGKGVFDNESINNRLLELSHLQVTKKGYFEYDKRVKTEYLDNRHENAIVEYSIENIKWVDSADGCITIHKEPEVKKDDTGYITSRKPYTIGGDTAGNGIDYFTAKVVDNITRECVATYRKQRTDDDLYAEQMYCLGKYYNDALISIEINFSRQPMRVLSQKYKYPNLYVRERIDTLSDKPQQELGFQTSVKTKPIIINNLVALMRENIRLENDVETLKEMLVFVRKENGTTSAVDGKHDDLVMALAIAQFCCEQGSTQWMETTAKKDAFHEYVRKNFHDDYYQEETDDCSGFIEW